MYIVTGILLAVFLLSRAFKDVFDNRIISRCIDYVGAYSMVLLLLMAGHWCAVLLAKL